MHIERIDETSPYLASVKALWRANSSTLGFFTDGAFREHATRYGIYVAIMPEVGCVAYLLYRISRSRVMVTHLCVARGWQGHGIARALVDSLRAQTRQFRGIGLRCRRDYYASRIWPHLGFIPLSDQRGKSIDGKELTFWWLDNNHPDIWTAADMQLLESKIAVVIDANVFFDLYDQSDPESGESKALLADWLQDSIELCVTEEIYNEINRNQDSQHRAQMRQFVHHFTVLRTDSTAFETAFSNLRPIFPEDMEDSDWSDLRQVARAIAAGRQFFVTRDTDLLDKADQIYNNFSLTLIRPSDLIVHLDELRRESEYQPARLAGTLLEIRLVHSKEQAILVEHFQCDEMRETRVDFQRQVRRFLAAPYRFECLIAIDNQTSPLAFMVYDRENSDELVVPMFRVRRGPIAATLARYLILQMLTVSAREHRIFTKICDTFINANIASALQDDAFMKVDEGWLKVNLNVAETADEIALRLSELASRGTSEAAYCHRLSTMLHRSDTTNDIQAMADLEKLLWPAKVIDANLPTFIVPIQPRWAQELFDEHLANQTLFGANIQLALNREAVYYRAKRPNVLSAPARILWYVSQDANYHGAGSVRACSRLDEIVVGQPKELYRQFRRLGVYEWNNVLEVAKGDTQAEIMAIRFSNTELFSRPVKWYELQQLLREAGCPSQLQSPHRIPSDVFSRLYSSGITQG